ncbi:MAG: hypothetical protein BGO49_01595 [Planctomycetales bacterium 71-10]|nr:MAG: hypothetical protein BGO49_01595 [Planctomycetales bacterium 71-10]
MDEPTEPDPGGARAAKTRISFDGWPVDGRISRVLSGGLDATGAFTTAEPAAPAGERFGDYELGRELGRGGMGVVYEARHVGLNRSVALKVVDSGLLAGAAEIQRFRIEAAALARLDHPRIVPIYEAGEADGRGYLAMRLVAGGNLADRLARYLGDPRAAAELAAEVAEAVHHAHSRGVLHRDLKPANILVDDDGLPLVSDFGLAKQFDDDSAMTISGALLGTPAFMSPEQAAGRSAAITTATDVYGLGTILYSMLAGRPPLLGGDVMEVLDAVRLREPERPSRHNRVVPRDLDTIALKCLEKDPRRRYATAHALAADLRAWLGSRPIAARRVGAAERAWLWCRRRPAVAALAAAAMLATVGGATAVMLVQARANAGLRESNARERRQFDLAMDAVGALRRKVADEPLLKESQFAPLRAGLLREAADFYARLEGMLRGRDDSGSLAALAGAYYELGDLTEQTGSKDEALAFHEKALKIRRELPRGGDEDGPLDLARSLVATARLGAAVGDAGRSDARLREAARLASGATGGAAADVQAEALEEIAELGIPAARLDEARAAYGEALAIRRRAAEAAPGAVGLRERLASLATSYGEFELLAGRPADAAALFDEAETVLGTLARSNPDDVGFRTARAGVLIKRGALSGQFLGRPRESLPSLMEARRLLSGLLAERPALVAPRPMLADCDSWRFLACWNLGRMDDALAAADDLAATAAELIRIDPRTAVHRSHEAAGLTGRALVLSRTGRNAEALPLFERAAREFEAVADAAPSLPGYRFMNISALVNVANELRLLGRPREALPVCERAAAVAGDFLDDRGSLLLVPMHLGESLRQLAEVRLACGDPAAAAESARRAVEILSEPPPQVVQACYERAAALAVLAGLARTPGSGVAPEEGPPAALAAVAMLRRVYDLGFRNTSALRSETAFAPLRDRPDYRAILADMEFPDDPFAP